VAASFRTVTGHVTQDIKLILFSPDAFKSAQQVVGIEDSESTRAFRQRSKDLLIGRSGRWELRHDRARLIVRRIVVIGGWVVTSTARAAAGVAGPSLSFPPRLDC